MPRIKGARRARSGMLYDDLHTQTMRFMYRLIRDRTRLLTRAAAPDADAVMAMLMPHHLGHSVGVNVHDATPGAWRLAENHVFTIEPGLYFDPDLVHRTRGLCAATLRECAPMGGIRIEDTFVMRDGVARSLVGLPVAADDIERALLDSRAAREALV